MWSKITTQDLKISQQISSRFGKKPLEFKQKVKPYIFPLLECPWAVTLVMVTSVRFIVHRVTEFPRQIGEFCVSSRSCRCSFSSETRQSDSNKGGGRAMVDDSISFRVFWSHGASQKDGRMIGHDCETQFIWLKCSILFLSLVCSVTARQFLCCVVDYCRAKPLYPFNSSESELGDLLLRKDMKSFLCNRWQQKKMWSIAEEILLMLWFLLFNVWFLSLSVLRPSTSTSTFPSAFTPSSPFPLPILAVPPAAALEGYVTWLPWHFILH